MLELHSRHADAMRNRKVNSKQTKFKHARRARIDYRYLGSIFRGPLTGVTIG
jgi:hypothetical protein